RTLAVSTYGDITRRPLYYILLFTFALAIFGSRFLTLFSFYQETNMVREMGMATITFWGFIILVVTSGLIVTQELEDRTAVTLLSKPIQRSDFLLGKFAGLVLSLVPGIIVLSGVLFLTLWMMASPRLPVYDRDLVLGVQAGSSPFAIVWRVTWEQFIVKQGGVVLEGAFLSFLQTSILAAAAVSFSAFFPTVVSVAATTLVFIFGNVSSYMLASVENLKVGVWSSLGRVASYLVPNLGYFNLQMYFSEGKIISVRYLGLSFAYTALYIIAVFLVSCSLFQKREVR
ncbi:MAG TPA: ABC transporter permease subunit, partial [Planctomycetota bacterium]|nr:ABC transporter permease subunit [Planctomycetota bacterium]